MNISKQEFIENVFDFENEKEWKYKGDVPCLIDFSAEWCAPCRQLSSILIELEKEYKGKINIYKIDVDNETEISSHFNIRSIPTILICKKDSNPDKLLGFKSKINLKEIIEDELLLH